MDNQQKTLLITVALVITILFLARPKNSLLNAKDKSQKLTPPKTVDKKTSKDNHDGSVIITAMREAINDNLPQKDIDDLNQLFLKEYKLKVFFGKDQKLVSKNINGKIVARE